MLLVDGQSARLLSGIPNLYVLWTMLMNASGVEDFPVVLGVVYCDPESAYDVELAGQVDEAIEAKPNADMKELLFAGSTWTVD